MPRKRRILILAHGHPELNPGGAEHVAYLMYRQLDSRPDCDTVLLAAHDGSGAAHDTTPLSNHTHDGKELLFRTICDPFRFRHPDLTAVHRPLNDLLSWFRPDVVHLHHYTSFGVEVLRLIRNWSESVAILLTLHEYLAICHHNGQMVKTGTLQLCQRATPAACARCFPERAAQDFFLREAYIKSMFEVVDRFVCPSRFLADRYADWGIPTAKLVYLENGQDRQDRLPARSLRSGELRGRFAFLGQLNPYKGVGLLLEAVERIQRDDRKLAKRISLSLHGWNLDIQTTEFRESLRGPMERTRKVVTAGGAYRREQLPGLLRGIDWVVVPSMWWENSPLVIQEAFKLGRPVIASDIGGMREKVTHGVNGLLFQAGNAVELADCLAKAARGTKRYERLQAAVPSPLGVEEWVDGQLDLYDEIVDARRKAFLQRLTQERGVRLAKGQASPPEASAPAAAGAE